MLPQPQTTQIEPARYHIWKHVNTPKGHYSYYFGFIIDQDFVTLEKSTNWIGNNGDFRLNMITENYLTKQQARSLYTRLTKRGFSLEA
jgi:hypothetical protein